MAGPSVAAPAGAEKAAPSFGIVTALLRWVIVVIIAWLFMYLTPAEWFVNWYLPMSFWLLMGTVTFGVIGLGWPLAVPGGSWKPGTNRWLTGLGMFVIWLGVGLILTAVERWVYPNMPLSHPAGVPIGVFFGISVFMVTLWYAFNLPNPRPFGPQRSWANWLLATVIIVALAMIFWALFVNLDIPPTQNEPYNSGGVWFGGAWFALCVWIIVWIQVWGTPMCFQGWPFYKLGKYGWPIVQTIVVILLGYAFYKLIPRLTPEGSVFDWAALGASMIGWTLMHSVAFGFWPFANLKQPMRGVANFVLEEIVLTAIWILLIRYVLGPPLLDHILAAFPADAPPGDINHITAWFTLHVTAIVLLVHNFFFMRAPWSIPGPPLAPDETPAEQAAKMAGGPA